MSAFGIALPVPTTTCSERCGSQCSVSRCQLSFSEAGQTITAGDAPSPSSTAGAPLVLPSPPVALPEPLRVGDEQPPRLQRVAHAGALEWSQLAAEPRLAGERLAVGG